MITQLVRSELRALIFDVLNIAHRLEAIDILLSNEQSATSIQPIANSQQPSTTNSQPEARSPQPELPEARSPQPALPEAIINAVCTALDVTIDDLKNGKRTERLADARALLSYFLMQNTRLKLVEIIKLMGLKNHSSVITHLKKVKELSSVDKHFADKKNKVENLINKL